MTNMLTCSCGAVFDPDEIPSGPAFLCPECQTPLAPPTKPRQRHTSAWAIASAVLALAGAFTLVGSLGAALAGGVALLLISKRPDRLAGAGYALFGLVVGIVFTGLTVFALSASEVFGVADRMREEELAEFVDCTGPTEILRHDLGFAVTRPTPTWGIPIEGYTDDPIVVGVLDRVDFFLVNLSRYSYLDVTQEQVGPRPLELCRDQLLDRMRGRGDSARAAGFDLMRFTAARLLYSNRPSVPQGQEAMDLGVEATFAGQRLRFVIRLMRRVGNAQLFTVRAWGRRRRFESLEDELRRGVTSFRLLGNP